MPRSEIEYLEKMAADPEITTFTQSDLEAFRSLAVPLPKLFCYAKCVLVAIACVGRGDNRAGCAAELLDCLLEC